MEPHAPGGRSEARGRSSAGRPRGLLRSLPRRVAAVALAIVASRALSGCESCSFGYGPGAVSVRVSANVAPVDLQVVVCDQTRDPAATSCLPATPDPTGSEDAAPTQSFTGRLTIEGTFSCGTGPFVVRATASNCDTATTTGEGAGDFRRTATLTLRCR